MKNIIILSASTGGGHNSVAKSLEVELADRGYNVIKIEPFKEKSKYLDFVISDGYRVMATKTPKMFGYIYKVSNTKTVNKSVSQATRITLKSVIYKAIQKYKPVLVISTHPLMVNVVSDLKLKNKINTPFISIVTDFIAHRSYINNAVDAYVVGSFATKDSLILKGIVPDKIFVYGIPVRREFHNKHEVVNHDIFTVLLMGGSMGMSGIKKVVKELMEINKPIKVFVVCGNNKTLYYSLHRQYEDDILEGRLDVYGFTSEVPKFMDVSDVIITKPGGLTTSESIIKNIPMIIPFFIPGQEQENAEFLQEAGMARIVKDTDEIKYLIEYLMSNPSVLNKMSENMRELGDKHSIKHFMTLIERLIDPREEMYLENWVNRLG